MTRNTSIFQPDKAFILKYFDFGWLNELRKEDGNANILELVNSYRQSNMHPSKGRFYIFSSLTGSEASNIILFYKTNACVNLEPFN